MTGALTILVFGMVGPLASSSGNFAGFLDAIRIVETGAEDQPEKAVGDGGRSIGPYQISRKYFMDSGLRGDWSQCRDRKFSESVMLAYWKRHCPDALRARDYETMARIHNGGPNGHTKSATLAYWRMVQEILKSQQVTARPTMFSPK